jgi:segregation and condensation protein B
MTALKHVLEAALMVAEEPLSVERMIGLFDRDVEAVPSRDEVREALEALRADYAGRGIELVEVASGYRIQVRVECGERMNRLWEERSPRYSRALLETLAIIAYRQPITRAEIEEIRGVSVASSIMRTLLDRNWVRVAGHRDVPGRPAVFATTREFLDYFNLKSLSELPSLAELRDIDDVSRDLFSDQGTPPAPEASGAEQSTAGDGFGRAAGAVIHALTPAARPADDDPDATAEGEPFALRGEKAAG